MTASPQLWRDTSMSPGFPGDKLRSDLQVLDREPSEQRSFSVAFSAIGTVACQPLTLSVVPFLRGAPDLPPPPPRQRTANSSDQSAWPRLRRLSACFRGTVRWVGRRCLQSRRSTSTSRISRTPFHPLEVSLGASFFGWPRPFRGLANWAFLDQGHVTTLIVPRSPR